MIIDCHSHFGSDYYCGEIKIDDYVSFCKKIGIDIGFLMPTPWPMFLDKFGNKKVSLMWEHDDYNNKYYYSVLKNQKETIDKNPYQQVNDQYFDLLKKSNDGEFLDLKFIPLIHGVLDEGEYLDKLLTKTKALAVKMHGFGSGFSPEEINEDVIDILKQYDLPIILHTSVYNYNYGYGADTKYWRNECHPMRWISFLKKHNLKGVLNHGACLNVEAIDEVNKNDNIMIGIGPDLDISSDYFKVDIKREQYEKIGYLKILKEKVLADKLLFDIDYNWNVSDNGMDYNQIDRFRKNWNYNELDLILYKNALNFYDIDKNKIKQKKRDLK